MFKKIGEFFSNLFKPEPMYAPVPDKLEPKADPLVQLGPEPITAAPPVITKVEAPAPAPVAESTPVQKKKAVRAKKPKAEKSVAEPRAKKPRASKRTT